MEYTNQNRIVINSDGSTTPSTVNPPLAPYIGLPLFDGVDYVIDTPTSLSASCSIALDGSITPTAGMTLNFRYMGQIATTNGNTVTIMGQALTNVQCNQNLNITAVYTLADETNASVWNVSIVPQLSSTPNASGFDVKTLTTGGGTITLVAGVDHENQIIKGSGTLSGSWVITGTGATNAKFWISYEGNWTLGANNITIFGTALTQAQATAGQMTFLVQWTGAAWNVQDMTGSANFPTQKVGVTVLTLPSAGGTTTLVSGVNNQTLNLIGTPTMSGSYTVTGTAVRDGDWFEVFYKAIPVLSTYNITLFGYTLTYNEALSGDIYVRAVWSATASAWIAAITVNNGNGIYQLKVLVPSAAVLTAYDTPVLLIPPQGTNQAIGLISCIGGINFNSAAYTTHLTIDIITDTATVPQFKDVKLLYSTATRGFAFLQQTVASTNDTMYLNNKGVYFTVETGNPAAGDSDILFDIVYQILT